MAPRDIVLLGATGSIGQSSCELLRRFPDRFRLVGASCGRRVEALAKLAAEFECRHLAVYDQKARAKLKVDATLHAPGDAGLIELIDANPGALIVNGLVGAVGMAPTIHALENGYDVALANKEALVVGGDLVLAAAQRGKATLWPVDSEHSAIAQCLRGNPRSELKRLWLTASGGPFRDHEPSELAEVSLAQVLNHPNWEMGPKITVDSASMMNKGLEIIEAHYLFGVPYDHIDVVIHRQSIVHSMIEMVDGAFLAQMGAPDMRIPILYALAGGEHLEAPGLAPWSPLDSPQLDFCAPNSELYPCLGLARAAGEAGGAAPLVLNAANEEAVGALLAGELPFTAIPRVIERALEELDTRPLRDLADALQRDAEARIRTRELARAFAVQ